MNYKLLFPTYRNRYQFIQQRLAHFGQGRSFDHILNLGTGEGDYDAMIAPYGKRLTACDINADDVAFAQQLNTDISHLSYKVENALSLSFGDNSFDLITSVDVIEHVGQPAQMIDEIGRVLRPDGLVFITFPSHHYPFSYDPINKIADWLGREKWIAQGAYAFGHDYLIRTPDFKKWTTMAGLDILEEYPLSGALVGLSEMYWTGIIQRIFKTNAHNISKEVSRKSRKIRPSRRTPLLVRLTDTFIQIDRWVSSSSNASVGRGIVLRKRRC